MCNSSEYNIKCDCGHIFKHELWDTVDVSENPELRQVALEGEINYITCPSCKRKMHTDKSFLYHDRDNRIMLWHYKESMRCQKEQENTIGCTEAKCIIAETCLHSLKGQCGGNNPRATIGSHLDNVITV